MIGTAYKTKNGWFIEIKNNEIIPLHPTCELDETNIGKKVTFDVVEEDNGGIGYTETYKLIKYAKII